MQDDSRKFSTLPTARPLIKRLRYEGEKPVLHPVKYKGLQ